MARASKQEIVHRLLASHGRTFANELGIRLQSNTPSPLFRLLCFSLLSSARIGAGIALGAARALADAGWTTARKMHDSTWRQRTNVLNRSGYARYDERTSTMLGDTAAHIVEEYGGDLRKLRDRAERQPDRERQLLKEFKGIGDTGADVFFREVQLVWDELYPFADRAVLEAARQLQLGGDPQTLTRLVGSRREFVRLVAALMRVRLEGASEEIKKAA